MRRLPKTLRLLSARVEVALQPDLTHADGDSCYGIYDTDAMVIWLRLGDSRERQKVTLIHEALHAMIAAGAVRDASDEEAAVTALAPLVLDFIRNNTGVIAYLQESN